LLSDGDEVGCEREASSREARKGSACGTKSTQGGGRARGLTSLLASGEQVAKNGGLAKEGGGICAQRDSTPLGEEITRSGGLTFREIGRATSGGRQKGVRRLTSGRNADCRFLGAMGFMREATIADLRAQGRSTTTAEAVTGKGRESCSFACSRERRKKTNVE